MGDVISIESKKQTVVGDAHCVECCHKWVAVSPVGTYQLQCPLCKSFKGIFSNPCCRFEYPHLTCSCGNDYLHITPEGYYCPRCGGWVFP